MTVGTTRCEVSRRIPIWVLALGIGLLGGAPAFSWVAPEHREIAILGVQKLDAERKAEFERIWADARTGHETRLCVQAADTGLGEEPTCLDWAAWPAIAGDHSCSAESMTTTVLETDWILKAARVTARLKRRLSSATSSYQRVNALRDSDMELQRADPDYATRAGSNNAHFLIARPGIDTVGADYLRECLAEETQLNALGNYAVYHASALMKAAGLAGANLSAERRSELSLAVLADEAFALHFLEDMFAAGHVAGTWGKAPVRKGTHDYYNEFGLATVTWEGKSVILKGDAYMRPEDAERAAITIRTSLEQVIDVASGKIQLAADASVSGSPGTFDVCTSKTMPAHADDPSITALLVAVAKSTPVPSLAEGAGAMPRFRAELGPFIGLSAGVYGQGISGGFFSSETTSGGNAGLDLGVRLGIGLEGVMNQSGDGLAFLELGFRQDTASTMDFAEAPGLVEAGAIGAAIPARTAYTARLRLPFYLIPGDLILALPILAFSTKTYASMAVAAANGGLIPWQAGIASPIGRFQFVLGREVGIGFYGYGKEADRFLVPSGPPGSETVLLVSARSLDLQFPIVEYRPFRSFSTNQSSGLLIQLYGGFDKVNQVSVIDPAGAPTPEDQTVYEFGLRVEFEYRHY